MPLTSFSISGAGGDARHGIREDEALRRCLTHILVLIANEVEDPTG